MKTFFLKWEISRLKSQFEFFFLKKRPFFWVWRLTFFFEPMLSRKKFATNSLKKDFLKMFVFSLIASVTSSTTSKTMNKKVASRVRKILKMCFSQLISNTDKLTGKSLTEALLFAEHGENMLCTKIVLNVRNNFCTQHVLPRFELGIFMYFIEFDEPDFFPTLNWIFLLAVVCFHM